MANFVLHVKEAGYLGTPSGIGGGQVQASDASEPPRTVVVYYVGGRRGVEKAYISPDDHNSLAEIMVTMDASLKDGGSFRHARSYLWRP